jgi:hypothetical protein
VRSEWLCPGRTSTKRAGTFPVAMLRAENALAPH